MFESITSRFTDILGGLRGRKITEQNIKDTVREIRVALLEADVAFEVVKDFVKRVREKALGIEVVEGVDAGQQFTKIVSDELTDLMGPTDPAINFRASGPTVILMAGLQGSGKTTTTGKLARMLREKHGKKPLLVAADLQRPAAIEQLKVLGKQLDIPVFHEPGLAPPKLCEKAVKEAKTHGANVVILDTAGRLHVDEELMRELSDVSKKTKPDETFLVIDAMTGQDAVKSAKDFDETLDLSGVILTKLDGDARGGAALSVKHVTGKTIKFVGLGEKLDKLEEFKPERMAQRILGMGDVVSLVEKAQEKIDQDVQERMQEKLRSASFDLDDFLTQIQQMKKIGSLREIMQMVPGMGALADSPELQGNETDQIASIIQSMTKSERARPEIINMSRRRRIAQGCGRAVEDVNDLLKQFKQMQGMMSMFADPKAVAGGGGGMFGKLKQMNQMRKALKGGAGLEQLMGGGMPQMPPGAMPNGGGLPAGMPGMPPGAQLPEGAVRGAGADKKALQKKRKAERKRRKDNRKRRK